MSEITKLYENAEVKKQIPKVCSSNELYCKECEAHIEDAMPYCKNAEYPPFTAEKQLKICKLLLKLEHSISYYFYENRYGFIIDDKQDDCIEAEKFEIALAMIVNSLWQDLTEEEKASIKNILEM